MTKEDIQAKLDELGIKYPADSDRVLLWSLLPREVMTDLHRKEVAAEDAQREKEAAEAKKTEPPAPVAPDTREGRWEAFLVSAREVNPERFDRQKARGEFDKIPDSFQ